MTFAKCISGEIVSELITVILPVIERCRHDGHFHFRRESSLEYERARGSILSQTDLSLAMAPALKPWQLFCRH